MEFGWLVTNFLCVVGAGYGWLNPFVGLMIYYLFAILRPEYLWFWAFDQGGRYSFFVAISTLAGWLLSGLGDFSKLKGVFVPLAGLILYVLCGIAATYLTAVNRTVAWEALDIQIKIVVMAVVTFSLVRTAFQIRVFAWVMAAGLGYLGWVFFTQSFFDGWNRLEARGFGGIDNNGAAMVMVMGVPMMFFIALVHKQWWVRGLCLVGAGALIDTVFLSNSRGGMVALCIVGMMLFLIALFLLPHKGVTVGLAIVFALMAYRLAGEGVQARFMTIFVKEDQLDASAASRPILWGAAIRCAMDHPMGVGPRNFNLIAEQYGIPEGKSVHNLFFQTAADYGILGSLGLAVFYFLTAWRTFWAARMPAARRLVWPRYYCHMVTVCLAGFIVCSMFIGMESVETGYLIAVLGLCTVSFIHRISETELNVELTPLPEMAQVPEEGEGIVVGG